MRSNMATLGRQYIGYLKALKTIYRENCRG
jgi:hypothetical protein